MVEEGIRERLYRLLFDEEYKRLEHILEKVASEDEVVVRTVEFLQNVGGSGYMTTYYYLSIPPDDKATHPMYEEYLKDHGTPISESLMII